MCVSFVLDQQVEFAAVSCPNLPCSVDRTLGSLFIAYRGEGAYEVSLHSGRSRRLPRRTDTLAGSTMTESFEPGHTSHGLSAALRAGLQLHPESLRVDSQCKYAMLARGDASLYLRKPKEGYQEKIWDHAPGCLLIQEVAGQMTDFAGAPVVFRPASLLCLHSGIAASTYSPADHATVLSRLS